VPKIKIPSPEQQRAYRAKLPPDRRPHFDELVKLIAAPRTDLDWYHEAGTALRRLRGEVSGKDRGTYPLKDLAAVLGPRDSFLQKTLRFTKLYPTKASLSKPKELGVDWTRLTLAFVVEDEKPRHQWLRKAVKQRWTPAQFRLHLQKKWPSDRRGVGGRPHRNVKDDTPDMILRELARLNSLWLHLHDEAWSAVDPSSWDQFVRDWPQDDRDALRQLLKATDDALKKVAAGCKEMRDVLAELRP
jgi:hypothetical protein